VEKIPATPPRGAIGANAFDSVYDQIAEARRILTGLGLNEAQGQTLIPKEECRMKNEELVALANPLSSDMDVLRPSLLPGLIHSLRHNVSHKNHDVALFEIGRVFMQGGDAALRRPDSAARCPYHLRHGADAPEIVRGGVRRVGEYQRSERNGGIGRLRNPVGR